MEKRIIELPTSKQQEEIDWAAQAIANNRAGIRLEAMKIAASIKTPDISFAITMDRADQIYNWVTKPE